MKHNKMLSGIISAAMIMSLAGCSGSTSDTVDTTAKTTETAENTTEATTAEITEGTTEETTEKPSENHGSLTGKTAWEVVDEMGVGFNIGNTLDAKSSKGGPAKYHESAWGNPLINQSLIDGLANAGITTVRIPTTWESFISEDGTYTIDPEYMSRVEEVVNYCYAQNMYIILNIHHEDWLENKDMVTNQVEIGKELQAVWTQIADNFADYDQHLIFEGMNEPRLKGTGAEWGGNSEAYETINYFNQIFVNAVRTDAKGHNDERCLMIPGYAASNSPSIMKSVAIPTVNGETPKNLIMSVHSYSPYDFCLSTSKKKFDLNSDSDRATIDNVFAAIKEQYLDHDIPVVIGETGATGKDDNSQRVNWATYMSKCAAEHGVPVVLWDNGVGGTTNESHKYFDRETGELINPDFINAYVGARKDAAWRSALGEKESADSLIGGKVITAYPDGNTANAEWDASYICLAANDLYFMDGNKVAVVFKGEGAPKMILDSEQLAQWWMPVEPDSVEEVNGYKVAYFNYDNAKNVMESFGVKSASQLRNMSFVSADGKITTYEVTLISEKNVVAFYANGQGYTTGEDIPADPEYELYDFLGWYSTKDFRPGTELTKDNMGTVNTAYAKLGLKK